jgi:hypothetical protein
MLYWTGFDDMHAAASGLQMLARQQLCCMLLCVLEGRN